MKKPILILVAIGIFIAGYFTGREHVKYEIRERMREAFAPVAALTALTPSASKPLETNEPKASSSAWSTREDKDPLTDQSIYFASVRSSEGVSRFGNPLTLTIRCKNNVTEAYINWDSYLGLDAVEVTYRIGKETAKTTTWSLSTTNKATFMPKPIDVVSQFETMESFVANVTPYNSNPITAVFDLKGAQEALADIRANCNW